MASLPLFVLTIVPKLLIGTLVTREEAALFSIISLVVFVVPTIMVCIKRFHDRGKSGRFVLVNFIPLIGPLWLLVELGFLLGTRDQTDLAPTR
jgi:uncharacterized membrane protein YhaH (DUF805 family)